MKPLTPKQKKKQDEGNISIAEFDGWQKYPDCMRWWKNRFSHEETTTDKMEYHFSLTALMDIVERIERMGYLFECTRFCDSEDYYCQFQKINFKTFDGAKDREGNPNYLFYNASKSRVTAIWLSVTAFIKNENAKNKSPQKNTL